MLESCVSSLLICVCCRSNVSRYYGGWNVPNRRYVPHFSSVAAPLTALFTKAARNPVQWDSACKEAVGAPKVYLHSSPVLQSPDFIWRFLVQVGTSATGVGAALSQVEPGEEQPLTYLSRKLLPREVRYSTIEK